MTKRMMVIAIAVLAMAVNAAAQAQVKYVKYQAGNRTAWGILDNDTTIRERTRGNAVPGGRREAFGPHTIDPTR